MQHIFKILRQTSWLLVQDNLKINSSDLTNLLVQKNQTYRKYQNLFINVSFYILYILEEYLQLGYICFCALI